MFNTRDNSERTAVRRRPLLLHKRRWIGWGLVLVILGLTVCGAMVGCANRITPPADVRAPVDVFLVDYGRHASLVLPNDQEHELVEYAYGDWSFFAQGRTNLLRGCYVLLMPTQGTIGRRHFDRRFTADELQSFLRVPSVYVLRVERERVEQLVNHLDERFDQALDSMIRNPVHQLYFVHDDQRYTLFHNCNHELVRWLELLDCEVRGPGMFSWWVIVNDDR